MCNGLDVIEAKYWVGTGNIPETQYLISKCKADDRCNWDNKRISCPGLKVKKRGHSVFSS